MEYRADRDNDFISVFEVLFSLRHVEKGVGYDHIPGSQDHEHIVLQHIGEIEALRL